LKDIHITEENLAHNLELYVGRSLFKTLEILPFHASIYSLMNFIVNNQDNFQTNSFIQNINTKNKQHLHKQNANLSCFKKVHYMMASEFTIIYCIVSQVLRIKRQNLMWH
jgi:squalene cyclase